MKLGNWEVPNNIPVTTVPFTGFIEKQVQVDVLRLDLISEYASGNKFFKLKYNVQKMLDEGKKTLVTFGGAYSNHIYATAQVAKLVGIESVGIIRGERIEPLNNTLYACEKAGMKLKFISRSEYRKKHTDDFIQELKKDYPNAYIVPEGGANTEGVLGCLEIEEFIHSKYDFILTACGTGGTLSGMLLNKKLKGTQIIGVPVLKKGEFIAEEVKNWSNKLNQPINQEIKLWTDYHFGGYAKMPIILKDFCESFMEKTSIPIEPVYTGKMFYAFFDQLEKGFFPEKSKILLIHTGGLQYL